MWETSSLWVDLFAFTAFMLVGNITFDHFEERTPSWRRLVKAVVFIAILTGISAFAGRIVAFVVLGVLMLPVVYIHGVVLPKKGINGWTGEPREKYYEFRGWDKDIFKSTARKTGGEKQ